MGVAALGGKLYAVGGYDGTTPLSSVEVFDPQTNAWTALAPMSTRRILFAMAAVQGKLYAAGGFDGNNTTVGAALATAEAYDPQQNRWELVAPMATARHSCAVVVV
jgi:kelch-like protein 17 (actinfilin)